MTLRDMRENYTKGSLTESDLTHNPLDLFDAWLQQVIDSGMPDANAMTVATSSLDGRPTQRILLLKGRPEDDFVFFTNYDSDKAKDIEINPWVSLHFPWYPLERQVHILGTAIRLSDDENSHYFAERPKESQLGALVSKQSRVLASRDVLVDAFNQAQIEHAEKEVTRPNNWGGYRIQPVSMEFWQGGEHRLHDRFRYERESITAQWSVKRLYP